MNTGSISFVLPMYNESRTIENTVRELGLIAREICDDYEIVIANDGSADNSGNIIDDIAGKDSRVKVVHLGKNTKFGGALKTGLMLAQKEVLIYIDSDLPVSSQDIKNALKLLDGADIVTAYSKVKKGENPKRIIMSKVYNFLIQFLFRTNIKDINSGFKIYKKKVFKDTMLISSSPFIDVEIFVRALRKGFKIRQYPLIFKHRESGVSYISRPAVVLRTMWDILKFRFSR